jgi:hypothetical protein
MFMKIINSAVSTSRNEVKHYNDDMKYKKKQEISFINMRQA